MSGLAIDGAQARSRALALTRGAWAVTKTASWLTVQACGVGVGLGVSVVGCAAIVAPDIAWVHLGEAYGRDLDPSGVRAFALLLFAFGLVLLSDCRLAIWRWWFNSRLRVVIFDLTHGGPLE